VRRFRAERGLSLGELARRSGLSKQTLSKVEQGEGNPTVETLSMVGAALDVSPRRLLTEWGTPVHLQRHADATWEETAGGATRFLDQLYGSGYVHTHLLRLDKDRTPVDGDVHPPGALHHFYVVTGQLRTGPVRDPVDLAAGDYIRFPADVPHRHVCLSDRVVARVVTTLPQVPQFSSTSLPKGRSTKPTLIGRNPLPV
jgi:transcriptional regulator with XRE-family HTH domain